MYLKLSFHTFVLMEIWKNLKNYESAYMISNFGRIKCLIRDGISKEKIKYLNVNKITGYQLVSLRLKNKITNKYVHRLVAEHFLSNLNNLPVVNHIDGNKLNNHVDNLQWCTHKDNINHAVKTGLLRKITGDDNHGTKIKDADLNTIFKMSEEGVLQKEIAVKFGVNPATISKILKGSRYANRL